MYIMHVVFSVPPHHNTRGCLPCGGRQLFIQHNQTVCAEGGKSYRTFNLSFKRVWKDSVVAYIHFSSLRVELATEIMCRGFPDSCSQAGRFHPTQSEGGKSYRTLNTRFKENGKALRHEVAPKKAIEKCESTRQATISGCFSV